MERKGITIYLDEEKVEYVKSKFNMSGFINELVEKDMEKYFKLQESIKKLEKDFEEHR